MAPIVAAVVVVALLVVGVSLVIAFVVVGAIALPPLRLSAVEISMGACSLLFFTSLRVLQTFAQLFC